MKNYVNLFNGSSCVNNIQSTAHDLPSHIVTNGEQFVPIYFSMYSEISDYTKWWGDNLESNVNIIKGSLPNIFSVIDLLYIASTSNNYTDAFSGKYNPVYYGDTLFAFGACFYIKGSNLIKAFNATETLNSFIIYGRDNLIPKYLVVVKAKHLKYIRACRMLQIDPILPYTDIKVINNTSVSESNAMNLCFRAVIKDLDIKIEPVLSVDAMKYISTPIDCTAEEWLEGARKLASNMKLGYYHETVKGELLV